MTRTPQHTHLEIWMNRRGSHLDQTATEIITRNHCHRAKPLPRRSNQAPWGARLMGDRRRLSPTGKKPKVCIPGGAQGPIWHKHLLPLTHQTFLPTPASLPSPTIDILHAWILTTSCLCRGCLPGDQKKAPRTSPLDIVPLSGWPWPFQHLLHSPCSCLIVSSLGSLDQVHFLVYLYWVVRVSMDRTACPWKSHWDSKENSASEQPFWG